MERLSSNNELPGKTVSATNFIRHFGAYSRTVSGEPLHILNHGRLAWSLIDTEYFNNLYSAQFQTADDSKSYYSLAMECVSTAVVFFDKNLNIAEANSSARRLSNRSGEKLIGVSARSIFSNPRYEFISDALERVRDTGISEDFETDTAETPYRTFRVRLMPCSSGIVCFIDDVTAITLLRDHDTTLKGYENLLDDLPQFARGSINSRGTVVSASTGLADLLRTSDERLIGMRLPSLVHSTCRIAVSDIIEQVMTERISQTIPCLLQENGAPTLSATLAFIPNSALNRKEGATFFIQKNI